MHSEIDMKCYSTQYRLLIRPIRKIPSAISILVSKVRGSGRVINSVEFSKVLLSASHRPSHGDHLPSTYDDTKHVTHAAFRSQRFTNDDFRAHTRDSI